MDDMVVDEGGEVYWFSDPWTNTATVTWLDAPVVHWTPTGDVIRGIYTFQAIMNCYDSTITFQYKDAEYPAPTLSNLWQKYPAETGIEECFMSGLTVPQYYLHDQYKIVFHHKWVRDVSALCIETPDNAYPAEAESINFEPKAWLGNDGSRSQTYFKVVMQILNPTRDVLYADTITYEDTLYPGEVDSVLFDSFPRITNLGMIAAGLYDVKCWVMLKGDQERDNDTAYKNVLSVTTFMYSPYTPDPPAIDGYMEKDEWRDASVTDISDLTGRGSPWCWCFSERQLIPPIVPGFDSFEYCGYPEGSALLYVKNDSNYLYLGLDAKCDSTFEPMPPPGLVLGDDAEGSDIAMFAWDDNYDRAYPCDYANGGLDSTEGILYAMGDWKNALYNDIETGVWFISINCSAMYSDTADAVMASMGYVWGSNVQYEFAIPLHRLERKSLGTFPNEGLDAAMGDTVGVGVTAVDGSYGGIIYAHWPQSARWYWFPEQMGSLVLGLSVHDVALLSIDAPYDTVYSDSIEPVMATVANLGLLHETFPVVAAIETSPHIAGVGVYADTVTVTDLAPGETVQVVWNDWHVPHPDSSWYTMLGVCILAEDNVLENNAKTMSIFAYDVSKIDHDLRTDVVTSPPDTINPGASYKPTATVFNEGNMVEQNVGIECLVQEHVGDDAANGDTVFIDTSVVSLFPNTGTNVEFGIWVVPTTGPDWYEIKVRTMLHNDRDPGNDMASKLLYAGVKFGDGIQLKVLGNGLPKVFALTGAVPNPTVGSTSIMYELPASARVSLAIYDATGSIVRELVNGVDQPGYRSVVWDGKSYRGESVPSGVYFYRLTAGTFTSTKKLVVLK
jgi:hypothetical protein